ncbi:MAG TPA: prolipoprotein diacylglyceryl transferase [Chloroflexia bacterium]|nr:prolipoprotein diacylglyceryl transferase [Chloroflexia bacterium]
MWNVSKLGLLFRRKEDGLPNLLLKWPVILGIYLGSLGLFFLLKSEGGNTPELLQLGGLRLRWYGLLIACGMALASLLAAYLAERKGENSEHLWRVLPVVLISSLVAARLWFVAFTWPTYVHDPGRIIAIWEGGIAIQGGVLGGLLGGYLYTRWANLKMWRWVDFVAPGLVLAQAIGRWGNFMNNEAYGRTTDLPWGIKIPCAYRTDGHPGTVDTRCSTPGNPGPEATFHPTFLYESLWDYACFLVLLYLALHPAPSWLERRLGWRRKDGDLFLFYWVIYSAGRFFTEGLRTDSLTYAGLRTAQVTAIGAIVVCSLWLFWRHRYDSKPDPNSSDPGIVNE